MLNGAELDDAKLNGANLNGANLNGANLNGAKLDRANLNGANLDRAKLDEARFYDSTTLEGADMTNLFISYGIFINNRHENDLENIQGFFRKQGAQQVSFA